MQEDVRRDFVTSQPAAGALFTVVLGELCDFLALRPSGNRLKGALRAAGTAISALRPRAQLAGSLRRTWPSTRTAPVTLSPLGQARAVAARQVPGWLLGDEEGACPVPCVSREERLGLLLGVQRQQVAPGRVAQGAGWGPCGGPAATEGKRVVARAFPQSARCWISSRLCRPRPTRRSPRNAVGRPLSLWCECVAKANHRGPRCDERDGCEWAAEARNAGRTWRG